MNEYRELYDMNEGEREDVKLLLRSRNVNANEAGPTGFGHIIYTTIQRRNPKFYLD
jgi:hypothetical protein